MGVITVQRQCAVLFLSCVHLLAGSALSSDGISEFHELWSQMDFVVELRHVLNFLQQNGFEKAAEAVYERLDNANLDVKQAVDAQERDRSPDSAPDYAGEYADQPLEEEYRSRSAEPVLVSSR